LKVKVLGTKVRCFRLYPDTRHVRVVLETGNVRLLKEGIETFNYNLVPGELAEVDYGEK
jgi:hypothetical protein